MDYRAAFISLFQHPKWGLNLLFVAICFLIPFVGPVVVMGYMARCKRAWHHGEQYPEFNFQYFVEYMKNGIWPFLVALLFWMIAVPLVMAYIFGSIFGVALLAEQGAGDEVPVLAIVAGSVAVIGFIVLYMVSLMLMVPLYLKSEIEQEFAAGFSWAWFKDFLSKVGGTLALSAVIMMVAYFPLILVGYIALIVGCYFTMAWWLFACAHVHFQLYELYLQRGGQPLTFSPKLESVPEGPHMPSPPPPTPEGMPPLPPE